MQISLGEMVSCLEIASTNLQQRDFPAVIAWDQDCNICFTESLARFAERAAKAKGRYIVLSHLTPDFLKGVACFMSNNQKGNLVDIYADLESESSSSPPNASRQL